MSISDTHRDGRIGTTNDGQPVVAQKGDGALSSGEALKDTDRPNHRHAARGEQRTTFYSSEGDGSKWDRLWKHQHGWHSDDTGKRARQDKIAIAEALSDSLHLTDALKDDVRRLVLQCDGRTFNRIGGLEAVALGCIAVAQNRTIDTVEKYENRIQVREFENDDIDGSLFKHLAEKHDVDWNKAISMVKQKVNG